MYRITDIKWKYNSEAGSLKPEARYSTILKLRDLENNQENEIPLKNYKFNFKLSKEKYCVGYYKAGEFKPCPINSKLENSSYTQCPYCEKIQGFKSAFLFGGEPNDEMKDYLAQKHYIYLVYFEPGIIKVGTAAESRKYLRPIEQDALVYCYIAESDGFKIQQLEHEISKQLGITENVRSNHKFKYLEAQPNLLKANEMLLEKYNLISSYFAEHKEFKDWIFNKNQIEIIDLSKLSGIFYPEKEFHLVKDELYVVGEYKGLRGRFLIIENPLNPPYQGEDYIAFDTRSLIGRNIEEYVSDWRYNVVREEQMGLGL